MLKQLFKKALILSSLGILVVFSSASYSCGDSCGGYGSFYDVGDYNLYSFAVDIGTYIDYSYTETSYADPYITSGCGSFSDSCGTSYSLGCNTAAFDLEIYALLNQPTIYNGFQSPNDGPVFPNVGYNLGSAPISPPFYPAPIYPEFSGPRYPQFPSPQFPGVTSPFPIAPPTTTPISDPNPILPFPSNQFPSNPFTGNLLPNAPSLPTSSFPTLTIPASNTGSIPVPPSVRPPYAGCDNVTIPCPGGPPTRPIELSRPPIFQPVTTENGNEPLRYQFPRGVVTH